MKKTLKPVFIISKLIHKYVGLVFLFYFSAMGISGVLLNHPLLIRKLSVPASWVPKSHTFSNWNRYAVRETAFSKKIPDALFVCGKTGVWQSRDRGSSFTAMERGFPRSLYDRDTRCLLMTSFQEQEYLYAGTQSGLYRWDFISGSWQNIPLESGENPDIVDLVQIGDRVTAFAPYAAYELTGSNENPVLRASPLSAEPAPVSRAPLYRLFFKLHDGSIMGLPGKLFVDLMGVALLFLSLSAVYIWYIPWRRRKFGAPGVKPRFFRFFHKYHSKFGIYTALFLVLITLTGIFLRPPFLPMFLGYSIPRSMLNEDGPASPWHLEIYKAVCLPENNTLLLATREGFFQGPADFSGPFVEASIGVPISGMGVTVLELLTENRVLIGSFSGLYVWSNGHEAGVPLKGGNTHPDRSALTNSNMVAGAAVHDGELIWWADYRQGVRMAERDVSVPEMPDGIYNAGGMSLWHFLFEFHNGRIFRTWLGTWSWLVIPLGGILLLICVFSGSFDWIYRRFPAPRPGVVGRLTVGSGTIIKKEGSI